MSLESLILRRLAVVHQKTVAAAVGGDETLISRFAAGERGLKINQLEGAFAAMGLRVVPVDAVVIGADELNALRVLARKALDAASDG